ncbi:MAG TPA: hypothetical protein VFF13_06855 [archaeon]|nr:hypothetical protein [archaeon]
MDSALISRIDALTKAFQNGKFFEVKRIGKESIKDAVVKNSQDFAAISVISYSLYKMLSKEKFTKSKRWPTITKIIVAALQKSSEALKKENIKSFETNIENAVNEIKIVDDDLSNYVKNIFEKAKVKEASTAYALGLSIGQSADLTGADKAELQKYIGFTRIHDEQVISRSLSQRLKNLKAELAK